MIKIKRRVKLCECGCGLPVKKNREGVYNRFIKGHYEIYYRNVIFNILPQECQCGCGELVKWNKYKKCWNIYLVGHSPGNKGKHTWNYGLTKETNPILLEMSVINKQYRHTKEAKKKIAKSSRERIYTEEQNERQAERSKKMWEKLEFREAHSGENHWNWQDGISKEPYSQEWDNYLKGQIRERDGYICQVCLKPQKGLKRKLDIHHIDYDKKNCDSDNLISLCQSCHMKTNRNREQWQSVFASQ
jgi:hypothetical protein